MKKAIWKFPIQVRDIQSIIMPAKSEILCVQVQNDIPCIWVLVDNDNEQEERFIEMYGTGHDMRDVDIEKKYIGTFQIQGGRLVFHLFERI